MHSGFVCATVWDYLISYFGDSKRIDFIPWTLPVRPSLHRLSPLIVHTRSDRRLFSARYVLRRVLSGLPNLIDMLLASASWWSPSSCTFSSPIEYIDVS
jgi:hypothetical protein